MREIENLSRFLGKTLFQKGENLTLILDENGDFSSEGYLLFKLRQLISEGKINEAENLLFDSLGSGNKKLLPVAIDFYRDLSKLSSEFLESCNYSTDEISDGISAINCIFELNKT